jgi:hypothetical protein
MSLLTEAQSERKKPGFSCGVLRLTESMSPEERTELAEALASTVDNAALQRALQNRGHDIGYQTLQRHRSGSCSCR